MNESYDSLKLSMQWILSVRVGFAYVYLILILTVLGRY